MKVHLLLAAILVCARVPIAYASDFFIITDTFKTQEAAQTSAASIGAWALDTDAYSALPPNLFAVVHGPFATRELANERLRDFPKGKPHKSQYVKDAGDLRVPKNLMPAALPPGALAAILGELSVSVEDLPGAENPCQPQEPFQNITISYVTLDRTYDVITDRNGFTPRRQTVDLGGFWIIKRTGEVERMRVCAE